MFVLQMLPSFSIIVFQVFTLKFHHILKYFQVLRVYFYYLNNPSFLSYVLRTSSVASFSVQLFLVISISPHFECVYIRFITCTHCQYFRTKQHDWQIGVRWMKFRRFCIRIANYNYYLTNDVFDYSVNQLGRHIYQRVLCFVHLF